MVEGDKVREDEAKDAAFNARMTRATMNIVNEYRADFSRTEGRKRFRLYIDRRGGGYAEEPFDEDESGPAIVRGRV